MSCSILEPVDFRTSEYIITHVFYPLQLPDANDHSVHHDYSLASAIAEAACLFGSHVNEASVLHWHGVSRMLENLAANVQFESLDKFRTSSQFGSMDIGDVLVLPIRAQNAGVIFRKQKDVTIFESFEISPKAKDVMTTQGKLLCSYPGPAIEIPNIVFDDKDFLSELVNFLVHMNDDDLVATTSRKGQSFPFTDTHHPRYVTELLTGILRSVGRPADIARISKRVGDDVVWNDTKLLPWRRSSLWLLIRVALQTTLDRSPRGHETYKEFVLFFMCRLAEEEICANLPSDLLHSMSAKISRRLRKLGSSAPDWLSYTVLQACTCLRSIIEDRWRETQATQRVSPLWSPSQLNLNRDIRLSLSGSRHYLRKSLADYRVNRSDVFFNPKHLPRGVLDDFLSSDGNFFEKAYLAEPKVTLYDVEQAVERSIDAWVGRVTNNDEACVNLEILAHEYSARASETYADNPELLSLMLLTTIELWVALDKIAIKEIPMLADYSPEIPTSLLEHLLLRKAASLLRLRRAHEYLSSRHSRSRRQLSVFSSITNGDSFPVRFYKRSSRLQRLKSQIEEVAQHEARATVVKLREMNARYAELQKMAESSRAEYNMDTTITIHEWPLPANQLQAEVVVFELNCPVTFGMWRTATFHLLVDLCSPSVEQPRDFFFPLSNCEALRRYLVKHPRSRLSLVSNAKPFTVSYPTARIPARQEEVCLKNALVFFAFDTIAGIPVSHAVGRSDSKGYCTYRLRSGPYHDLQKYVDSTSHTSNEVMANQADCHKDLSIHEYMAFGHLRSGGLLQWLNILRELRGRSLSFRRHEVHMLLAQAISQVGPLSNAGWTWHQEIQQPTFCHALLGELQSLIRNVEASWLEVVTMDTISVLLRRLFASSPDQAISLEAVGLLRTMRSKVFSWVHELLVGLLKTPGDEGLREVLRDTAAICRSTFDVDPVIIPKVLHSTEDIEVLLSSAIIIHDHTPHDISHLSAYSRLLLDRDHRLSLALEDVVRNIIQADFHNQGINLAIRRIWPGYRPGSKWRSLEVPNSRWFSCTTAPRGQQRPQVVHFNILDGSLLINGKPIGAWLPNEFVRHPLYKLIFGDQTLEVIPSDLPGMDYLTRGMIFNHQVYFSLGNSNLDLVIRAKRKRMAADDSEIIELIPHGKLAGDLPTALIEGHAHWLDLSTSTMEIRPLESLWEASSENWRIDCTPGRHWMWKGREFLIDIRSQSWCMVSSLLSPLCTSQDLIVSVSSVDSSQSTSSLQLSVVLPRYDLSFYVDEDGDLQSRNIRGTVYDENQSIGALFGLVNRLVLRPKTKDVNAVELIPRCVLIPDGDISFRKADHHVCVEIATNRPTLKRVTFQTYKADTDLGCLTGNASLTSKLYLAYLHALTSGCSTDPLTGRSGTEEALSVLRSADCWSTMGLSPRDAELLGLIASICPLRAWHSSRRVQKVEWRNLPSNSQSHELFALAKAIKERYEQVQLFHEGLSSPFQNFPFQSDHLLKRSARQASYLFPFEFSGPSSTVDLDVRYPARELLEADSGERRAYIAATYVYTRKATGTKDIPEMVGSWTKNVSGNAALSLQYDKSWLAPNLPLIWLKAYNLLRKNDERKWFQLLFSLPAMAYTSSDLSDLVPVFVAFASHPQFRSEDPPHYSSYSIPAGCDPSFGTLRNYVVGCAYPLGHSPESLERAKDGENPYQLKQRQVQMYGSRRNSDADAAVQELLAAWPCETSPPCSLNPDLYDVADLASRVQRHFSSRFRNLKLKEHLTRVQMILNDLHSEVSPTPDPLPYSLQPLQSTPSSSPWSLTIDQLLARPAPLLSAHDKLPRYTADTESINTSHTDFTPLHRLITMVETDAANPFQRRYVSSLRTSAECLGSEISPVAHGATKLPSAEILMDHYTRCRASYIEALNHIQQHLGPENQSEQAVEQSGQWPRITAHALFRSLASNSPIVLSDDWRRCLMTFTLLGLELQRARRLLLLHSSNLHEELCKELQNEGCDGWKAEAHPDWLLIQLQSNLLIRRIQAEVANEMISPRSGGNTTMQLNMGEGKTSVIVPIVAVVLANGEQLVRVIVPKPLTVQTLHLLADRLGGLTNRRIYYIPFSRSLAVNHEKVASLRQIMSECMREHGVLVVQPGHILSLKLLSVEKQLSQAHKGQLAHPLLELQRWLYSHSRDILDESDEVLDVRSQLVFTIGGQQDMEGSPERWTTTEQILGLVGKHASSLRELFPLGVEFEPGPPGSFPYLRISQADAGQKLISWIVQDVIDDLLPNICFGQLRPGLRDAIRSFVSCEDACHANVQSVEECFRKTPLWAGLLLLRGLFANGILLFAFSERRWRVDYGLAPTRTMLAVPYRAKDVPAQRAEFGHPDIVIILTCLSYYYGGLNEEQLELCFGILFKQHDACLEYDLWVRACPAVLEPLRTLSGINIKSVEQWTKSLFPLFSRNRATVNFYLSNVVFPRESKEFPSKLSSSGWDLAEKKDCLLTGFSGTNDGQYLLPLHVIQRDPDHQRATNAKILSYLLRPENKHYMCMTHKNGERRTTPEFLKVLVAQEPEIRVLLDVGAQMLDLQNYELAKAWLHITPNPSAAIYFNEDDELMVYTRDGSAQLLRSSPYAGQVDRCIVYLDDAHTRGTDIKFPSGFRAAVTLGPKVTKDRLVQGCMRMRKLGQGHSIMLFASLEVDWRIRSVAGKDKDLLDVINTIDILHWAIRETWDHTQRWAPHWVQQGMDHTSRYAAWSSFCRDQLTSKELSDEWLQPEAKSLEDLYAPRNRSNTASPTCPDIRQRCIYLGVRPECSVSMDEEQEREVIHEIAAGHERQVERPSRVQPADHSIHQDVVDFIKTGVIPGRTIFFRTRSKAFKPAFDTLDRTPAATDEAYIWSQSVFATPDFEQTVEMSGKTTDYLRPVHWIVSAKRSTNDMLVILSPYEVNCLLPNIRSSKKVHLHLYTPRIIKSMKSCDDLALYSIPTVPSGWTPPSSFMDQLSVFAGQLYLKDYETYVRLCRFLCVYTRDLEGEEGMEVEPDGFILPRNRGKYSQIQIAHTFSSTPLVALRALVDLRSKDVDFTSTHMGKLLCGQLLSEGDFDA